MSNTTFTVYELIQCGFINDNSLQNYEIFDEDYRKQLNHAILNYYKWREICYDNPNKWLDQLENRIDLLMRNKYNELYKAKQTEFNLLYNIELHETFTHNIENEGSGTSTSNMTGNSNNKNINSTLPSDEMLNNNMFSNSFADGAVISDSTDNSNTSSQDKSNNKMVETYTKDTVGSSAGLPFSKAMIQFQQYCNKFNLDLQLIQELKEFFLTVY